MIISDKNIAVIGSFFGDEAKARCVNLFAKKYDFCIRFSGSSNAGHTLYHNGKKIVRHLLPSCDFSQPNNKAFLGSGMVINPNELIQEVKEAEEMFHGAASRIFVDPDAFVILPEHIKEDREKNVSRIGSTGKGVSPSYVDKTNRCGIKLQQLIKDNNEIILQLKKLGVQFKYSMELMQEFEKSSLIFEGAQSVLLDINFGTYPFVTSGDCALGGIVNAGFANLMPHKVYGVAKAYSTRVGNGPFPTEIFGEQAEELRTLGSEWGATTGRPRRVGWLDIPALRYAAAKGGLTHLILTKLDILTGMKTIPVASSYQKQLVCGDDFFSATPTYTHVPGWTNAKDLSQIKPFVDYVEQASGLKVEYISAGVNDEDFLKYDA